MVDVVGIEGVDVRLLDADGNVDASVGPIDVVTNSFTASGGDGSLNAADTSTINQDNSNNSTNLVLPQFNIPLFCLTDISVFFAQCHLTCFGQVQTSELIME